MLTSPPQDSERRQATIVFADISGFTAMSEKLDAEEVTAVMNDCFDFLGEIIKYDGGKIDKFIGDCVMALFGVPTALEDAPQRAINAAIDMRNGLEQFNREKELRIPLEIHIGINSGEVISGSIGSRDKREYTVMGDAVNLASRLEDASERGQILVGLSTYHSTKGTFEYRELPPFSFKGKREPVSVFELLSQRATRSRVGMVKDRRVLSQMVGRQKELDRLELQVMKAINGEGSIVNLIGEAGIGKSRLVEELKVKDVARRTRLLEGRGVSTGKSLGFHPVTEMLCQWAHIREDDGEAVSVGKLEETIRKVDPENMDEIVPFVATLMGMKLSGKHAERTKNLEGAALSKLILKNVGQLIARLSEAMPLVVIMEDLHWADSSTIELLEFLFHLARKCRAVFINVFRPGHDSSSDRISRTVQNKYNELSIEIRLRPLNGAISEKMVGNLLGSTAFPSRMAKLIVERTGGNPLFIEEVIRSLIDDGVTEAKNGGIVATGNNRSIAIPRNVGEIVLSRFDKLEEETRELLRIASVIGRRFLYRILEYTASNVASIDERVSYLEDVELIQESGNGGEVEYSFKHTLVQDAIYNTILVRQRGDLHLEVARAIESVFPDRLQEFSGMLAYHYGRGKEPNKAEEYLIKAGEMALNSSASTEAIAYYSKALELYSAKPESTADRDKTAMLERSIALAHYNKGHYGLAVEHFDKALVNLGYVTHKHTISVRLSALFSVFGIIKVLRFPARKHKEVPTERENTIFDMLLTRITGLMLADFRQAIFEFLRFGRVFLKYDMRNVERGVDLLCGMAQFFWLTGVFPRLSKSLFEYIESRISEDDTKSLLTYTSARLRILRLSGEWDIEYDEDLVTKNLENGEVMKVATYVYENALLAIEKGDLAFADYLHQSLVNVAEEYGMYDISIHFRLKAWLLLKTKRLRGVADEIDRYRTSIDEGAPIFLLDYYGIKLETELLVGNLDQAEILIDRVKASLDKGLDFYARNILLLREFLFRIQCFGRSPESGDRTAVRESMKIGRELTKTSRKNAMIRTEALRLMGIYHWQIGKPKKSLQWLERSIKEGERLGARLQLSRTYFEVGKRLLGKESGAVELGGISGKEYLDKAEKLFQEMELEVDLEELEKARSQISV